MSADGISSFDTTRKTRTDDGSTGSCVRSTPVESVRTDTVLIRVRCKRSKRSGKFRAGIELNDDELVNMTLEGYKFFSLSLSVVGVAASCGP